MKNWIPREEDNLMCPMSALPERTQHQSNTVPLPVNIRTAMKYLSIEPSINRSAVCPKCFTAYELSDIPERCAHRETPRSRVCNAELLLVKRAVKREFRWVPRCLYSTQHPEPWIESFLMRPGIEDLLDTSYNHVPRPDMMECIWDSPAWQSLGAFTRMPGNLTFSFYIDWFDPGMNKIAGKKVSCGAIMMFCLNLPYELQHLPENTYFVGLTPPPKEPSVTTITALVDPIIKKLAGLYHGKTFRTYRHPLGIAKQIAVLQSLPICRR
ncbi:hypothetical protein NMY22_g9923 [Coprinellus aureogranulatus]|nr:hypothetical protein NMY22_g9923 [Coprinellus aureogranulatus]